MNSYNNMKERKQDLKVKTGRLFRAAIFISSLVAIGYWYHIEIGSRSNNRTRTFGKRNLETDKGSKIISQDQNRFFVNIYFYRYELSIVLFFFLVSILFIKEKKKNGRNLLSVTDPNLINKKLEEVSNDRVSKSTQINQGENVIEADNKLVAIEKESSASALSNVSTLDKKDNLGKKDVIEEEEDKKSDLLLGSDIEIGSHNSKSTTPMDSETVADTEEDETETDDDLEKGESDEVNIIKENLNRLERYNGIDEIPEEDDSRAFSYFRVIRNKKAKFYLKIFDLIMKKENNKPQKERRSISNPLRYYFNELEMRFEPNSNLFNFNLSGLTRLADMQYFIRVEYRIGADLNHKEKLTIIVKIDYEKEQYLIKKYKKYHRKNISSIRYSIDWNEIERSPVCDKSILKEVMDEVSSNKIDITQREKQLEIFTKLLK